MGVTGSELWELYKACDQDVQQFHACIADRTAIDKLRLVRGSKFYMAAQ